MSTRACIARKTADGEFVGVYHHWDGYPTSLGATLFAAYNGHFAKDLPAMLRYLIDEHPAGWSSINEADFSQPPGYEENGIRTSGPHCYCHGGRKENGWRVTEKNASGSGVEWAYVFDVEARTLAVLSSTYSATGDKMIGMFGHGAPASKVFWKVHRLVQLDGKEPRNWDAAQRAAA